VDLTRCPAARAWRSDDIIEFIDEVGSVRRAHSSRSPCGPKFWSVVSNGERLGSEDTMGLATPEKHFSGLPTEAPPDMQKAPAQGCFTAGQHGYAVTGPTHLRIKKTSRRVA
jgi:hypothetical protein